MKASPVDYVQGAELRGNLFDSVDVSGALSSAYTSFFLDHAEPFDALKRVRENGRWPLGDLLEGHEFLLVLSCGPVAPSDQSFMHENGVSARS